MRGVSQSSQLGGDSVSSDENIDEEKDKVGEPDTFGGCFRI